MVAHILNLSCVSGHLFSFVFSERNLYGLKSYIHNTGMLGTSYLYSVSHLFHIFRRFLFYL